MKLAIALLAAAACAWGQKLELKLDVLAAKASEKAEIDLDAPQLENVKQLAGKGLSLVKVRHYEFSAPGAFSRADLDHIYRQLGANSGWKRIVSVKDKDDDVEIYVHQASEKTAGLLVIATEPKELSVVLLAGDAALRELVKSNIQYDLGPIIAAAAVAGAK